MKAGDKLGKMLRRSVLLGLGLAALAGGKVEAQTWRRRPPPLWRLPPGPRRRARMAAWRQAILARRRANLARFIWVRRHEQALRGEILAINPSPGAIAHARELGFTRLRASGDGAYGVRIVVLAAPPNMTTEAALARLEADDPQGAYEFNHVYDPSQAHVEPAPSATPMAVPLRNGAGVKIGMIDSGVSTDHPALRGGAIQTQSFAGDGRPTPSPHGTAVASLLVGRDGEFHGIAPGAQLLAADVFGESVEGGSAEAIANALIWMAHEGVNVVNISLTGPPNRGLDAVCRAMMARGMILVAAVGNDGPTSPVAYPAAIAGVVAVTAVDAAHRVLLTANRGPEIAFSSYGVSVTAAVDDGGYETMSGTSFAAPLVTAELALRSRATSGQQALQSLSLSALDLGAPGRDDIYGYGFVV